MLKTLFLTLAMTFACQAGPIHYIFQFQPLNPSLPQPTGEFTYDATTAQFADFRVVLNGVTYDFTDHANLLGGNRRIPFELGFLASNLISGTGIGPTQWWADDNGFQGFDWRTPAEDFLYYSFAPSITADPRAPVFEGPNAYSGTWTTSIAVDTPEPGTWLAGVALGGLLLLKAYSR